MISKFNQAFELCLLSLILVLTLTTCTMNRIKVDLIIHNAKVYTVDENFSIAEAIAIKDGKIIEVGSNKTILSKYTSAQMRNVKGKYVYPGFYDSHCHFYGYGLNKKRIDLTSCSSFEEVLKRVTIFADENKNGWIVGRGWDQNLWAKKDFPDNEKLNELFPDRPVMLIRVDGHAVLVNQKAYNLSGVNDGKMKKFIHYKNGKFSGILLEKAADMVKTAASNPEPEEVAEALITAEKDCIRVGLTSITDAGLDPDIIDIIDQLHKSGKLLIRINAMLNPGDESISFIKERGILKTSRLHVCSIKLYADGALGSRGACLLEPYSDQPGHYGTMVEQEDHYRLYCQIALENHYQICCHAIGDSANRMILNIYSEYLKGPNDRRWRIEHAQVINEPDFSLFREFNIIPSIQPAHATSDMDWAEQRLGHERIKNAYAYKKLMHTNRWLPFGSDFPVEQINPIYGFYSAVFRQDKNGKPEQGFQAENSLSRSDALRAMTIWAAKASFEEAEKGSIETGKYADIVILDQDLLNADRESVYTCSVLITIINGQIVYKNQ